MLGEAGVGKSRLGRELLARHREATGLVAQAYPLAASAAFGLWTEAVDPLLQTLPEEEVVELCGGLLDDLASLFHRVALVRGSVPERDPPLPRLLQGLAGLLVTVSRPAPLVVQLDDVHFADASSWEALRYLARHLDGGRLLVLATSRPAELAAHDVAAPVLFELEQDGFLSRLDVAALARPAIAELAEEVIERPPPAHARGLAFPTLAGQSPVCDRPTARARRGAGRSFVAISAAAARKPDRPCGVGAAPARGRAPQAMAELLAVIGRPVSFGDLVVLTGDSLEEVGTILTDLVGRGS